MKRDPLKLLSDIVSAIEEILDDAEGWAYRIIYRPEVKGGLWNAVSQLLVRLYMSLKSRIPPGLQEFPVCRIL